MEPSGVKHDFDGTGGGVLSDFHARNTHVCCQKTEVSMRNFLEMSQSAKSECYRVPQRMVIVTHNDFYTEQIVLDSTKFLCIECGLLGRCHPP